MNWESFTKWYGIAIVGWIAVSVASSVIKSRRAGRFGIKYIKLNDALTTGIALIMGATFFYGWFHYPDAPLFTNVALL